MLEVQKYLQWHTLDEVEDEFGILTKRYVDRVVLNYKIDSKPKYHPIVQECRGLILSRPDFNVLSRSLDRFYNYQEGNDYKTFHWNNCIVFPKLDGSLINLYNDGNIWVFATRGTAYAEGTTESGITFKSLVDSAIDNFDFLGNLDTDNTYIFELTSPHNRVIVSYPDTKLTLLAVRDKHNGAYADHNVLKNIFHFVFPESCGIELVKTFDFNDPDSIIEFVESKRGVEQEGVVTLDNFTQNRIKIKSTDYVALHHMRGDFSKKNFVTLLLKGEEQEFLTYFPEYGDKLTPYVNKFNELKKNVIETYDKYKHIDSQKEFALIVKDLPYAGFVFAMRKGLTTEQIFSINKLNQILKLFNDL